MADFQRVEVPEQQNILLYIGSNTALADKAQLLQCGVTHVLSVQRGFAALNLDLAHLVIDADEELDFDLQAEWPQCCTFMDEAFAGGGAVLVHSEKGASRSGATIAAYLVHKLHWRSSKCLQLIQEARWEAEPNAGFIAQLLDWERVCRLDVASIPGGAHMHEIRPGLWLGSITAVSDWKQLQNCHVSRVLTCGRKLEAPLPAGVVRLATLEIDDLDQVDILEHLPETSDMIRAALADGGGGVLVHCAMGASRSASVVIAHVMREEGLSYQDAVASVRGIRSVVQPNPGFSHQLEWYGKNCCPPALQERDSGRSYRDSPEFAKLLRKYTAADVRALCDECGAGDGCRDKAALQMALEALDRLQNACPADAEAREEKRRQSKRINDGLE